jgi:hypothetical protein
VVGDADENLPEAMKATLIRLKAISVETHESAAIPVLHSHFGE